MFIIYHNNQKVISVEDYNGNNIKWLNKGNITETLLELAKNTPDALLVWCFIDLKCNLNLEAFDTVYHHKYILASYHPSEVSVLPDFIGYVERSFYLKINKNKTFPTWLMSPLVGAIYGSTLLELSGVLDLRDSFSYHLLSISKIAQTEGLFCYSEPQLLLDSNFKNIVYVGLSHYEGIKFVKQHYKWIWSWYLLFCFIIYESKFPIISFLRVQLYRQKQVLFDLSTSNISSKKSIITERSIDVVIPTIGRRTYLHDVLKDFSKQTLLPKRIIIVEQSVDQNSVSELDYLKNESWPFEIVHHFTHQKGVVNARNLGIASVRSEWVFLGDDDNRFGENLLSDLLDNLERYGVYCGLTVYLQPHENQIYLKTAQTSIFGAGNAILKHDILNQVAFNSKYEFNYGEDTDFGMQIRNSGYDVVYFAEVRVTHLKASIGGYRTLFKQAWDEDAVKPSPSPTIMLLYLNYYTNKQLQGYQFLFFIRKFKSSKTLRFFGLLKLLKLQWERSIYWAKKL
ncbi:glycosyltransferase family 2 protein [Siansivirga zeaxanthinifaciens]|uniref:Glycosyl transferase n=1 Tax=Siansivirga zeaxanthinifaciens CC-SAMT-1 TaxID=1454006 RepID=A0A0C5WBZ6_9FLAO|nr:glycosyltransferase family A protein [Siansivirga zeaxanthinifaciens]AJR03792.1 glycosyl transferase [Siansivirga zeaxanthinifaciens CC-SAMT-1]